LSSFFVPALSSGPLNVFARAAPDPSATSSASITIEVIVFAVGRDPLYKLSFSLPAVSSCHH
jgi:hypothetical protein